MRRALARILYGLLALATIVPLAAGGWLWSRVRAAEAELRPEVEALRTFRTARPGWSFPSQVYTDWFTLAPGEPFGAVRVEREARARGYQEVKSGGADVPEPGWYTHPAEDELVVTLRGWRFPEGTAGPATVRVVTRDQRIESVERLAGDAWKGPFRLEPLWMGEWIGDANELRAFVPLARIPRHVRDAVLASEDARFADHPGIDPIGIARAVRRNTMEQEAVEGGSTLTQQLVRTLFLSRERSFRRKAAEAIRALALERILTKDQILEMYLNSVYLGQRGGRGIGGVAAGARAFFDTDLRDLTLEQAALLAAVIPAPNTYSPWKAPEKARERRDRVVDRMAALGLADPAEVAAAKGRPISLAEPPRRTPWEPLYSSWARRHLDAARPGEDPAAWGLTVVTALDPVLQVQAAHSMEYEVVTWEASWGRDRRDPLQGAVFGVDPATALAPFAVPGRKDATDQFHRAVQARRQPGSAIKPIAYAAAFSDRDEQGRFRFTPASTVEDQPRDFDTPEGPWRPRNAEGFYHPWVSLAKAFGKSLNVATTNLVTAVGPPKVAALAQALGIREPLRPVPSIGLGTSEVTLAELTSALASIAAGGVRVDPSPVRLAVDPAGRFAYEAPPPRERVVAPEPAAMVMTLMRNSYDKGTGWLARSAFGHGREVAGKTGTSQRGKDLWFVGVTPRLAVGVWLGHDHGRPMFQTASDTIAPTWGRVARPLFADTERIPFTLPESMELQGVEPYSGCRGGSWMVAMPRGQPWPDCRPVTWEIPEESEDDTVDGVPGEAGGPGDPVDPAGGISLDPAVGAGGGDVSPEGTGRPKAR